MTQGSTRRTVLATGAAAALAAGCSDSNSGGGSSSAADAASAAPRTPSTAPPTTAAAASPSHSTVAGEELTRTSDVPVGGGKIIKEHGVVVTQPVKGQFKAFSAICTHQGCTVASVENGTIACPCHGSMFHAADGSVAHGPAARPLAPKEIKVEGNSIHLA